MNWSLKEKRGKYTTFDQPDPRARKDKLEKRSQRSHRLKATKTEKVNFNGEKGTMLPPRRSDNLGNNLCFKRGLVP